MNNKYPKLYFLIIVILLLVAPLVYTISYFFAFSQGRKEGKNLITQTYFDNIKKQFGDLLYETKYLVSVKGKVSKIQGNTFTLTDGDDNLTFTAHDKTLYTKGPDINLPAQMTGATYDDLKIGDKVYASAYFKEDKSLYAYIIFIYK